MRPLTATETVFPRRPRLVIEHTGVLAAAAWLAARGLVPDGAQWSVEIDLDIVASDGRFTLEICAEEWGFIVRRGERESWIRVTDVPFVHGRDDFQLLGRTPQLDHVGDLLRSLEEELDISFNHAAPRVRSSCGGDEVIAAWARRL